MEDFIEKVKINPGLWDVDSLMYRDVTRKDACWESVAKECGMESGKEAKLLWKRLRDSHREALRRRRQGTNIARPWKYEQLMEFILPYGGAGGARESNRTYDIEADELQIKEEGDVADDTVAQTPKAVRRNPKRNKVTLKSFEERALRRRSDTASSAAAAAARRSMKVVSVQRAGRAGQAGGDALAELFSSMCKKTRQLPRHLQLRVQRDVFESVTRAEEEALCYADVADLHSYMFKGSPAGGTEPTSRDPDVEID